MSNPPPDQGGYGQQPPGQYGPPPGQYGPPPGQYGPPPGQYGPRKSRTGLIVAVAAAVVLLVAGGAVILATAGDDSEPNTTAPNTASSGPGSTGSSSSTPSGGGDQVAQVRAVAETYVKAVNTADQATAIRLTCKKVDGGSLYRVGAGKNDYQIGEVKILNANEAAVYITLADSSADAVPIQFEKRDGGWCVSV